VPRVSVVIPTYNRAHLIGEAIMSVLKQTFTDFELIVVDDGSTDNTKEMVDSLKDPRIKYIYQNNHGVAGAFNAGIKISTGEYIAFLGSDDMLLENALEKGVNILDAHPESGFSYGQGNITGADGHVFRVRKSSIQDDSGVINSREQVKELLFYNPITASSVVVRRSCFDEVGGYQEKLYSWGEDHLLSMQLAKRHSVAYIAEPLVNVRFHPNQLSRKVEPEMVEMAFLLILQEVFGDPDIAPQFENLKNKAYCHFYLWTARKASFDAKVSRSYFRKAINFYPHVMLSHEGFFILYKYLASLLPKRVRLGLGKYKMYFFRSALEG
jgi:glycosyltransferase involved in cell wall biosynthesis